MGDYKKTGYLQEPFRFFHLKDSTIREINLHYHDFYKILVFHGGNVTYMIEGKSYVLEPGDIVLVNKGDIHKPTVDFSVPYERSILYISSAYLEQQKTQEYNPFLCFEQAMEKEAYVLRCNDFGRTEPGEYLRRLETAQDRYGSEIEKSGLLQLFLLALNRMCIEEKVEKHFQPAGIYNQKVMDLLSYIKNHLFEEISIDKLADTFYISKYHMMRQFKNETGYSIHKYILEKRISVAKEKLAGGTPAVKVSEECGFKDYSTFLRAFQSSVHMTPTEFSQEMKDRRLYEENNLL